MSPLFNKKALLTPQENGRIVEAIRSCEKTTSGEIRVFMESRNPLVNTLERAAHIFHQLKMQETHHRNGVLLYVAVKDREVALYGDEGIHQAVGAAFWDAEVKKMLDSFRGHHITDGIVQCVLDVGQVLKEKFPYISTEDKNELPDEIVFGH
mgnify:CR=1 FL=1